jgi:anthranilate phosphoribosyltransferase
MLIQLTDIANRNIALTGEQIALAVNELCLESVSFEEKSLFLIALARKGETVEEISAFARELRNRAIEPRIEPRIRDRGIMDVCGTGGDRLGTFNVSTTVSILVAAAGVVMAKHGNRAVTSKLGSADVVDALGIPTNLDPDEAGKSLGEHQFAFLFAPNFHPAFKQIAPARKYCAERGHRTIFNFLGPLLNPARPSFQLVGVPDPALCEPMARVLFNLGIQRGMVVCGAADQVWMDEFSTLGETTMVSFDMSGEFKTSTFASPYPKPDIGDLAGGNRDENAMIVRNILTGRDKGPKRDIVLLNAGAALTIAGLCTAMDQGMQLAADLIDSGTAEKKLHQLSVKR